MATVHGSPTNGWGEGNDHPVWSRLFSKHQQDKLISEDLEAGYSIPAILIGVVLFGFLSMVYSVWSVF